MSKKKFVKRKTVFFALVAGLFFFLLSAQKKKKQKEKAPSALLGLLRQVFPLNEKNSLRSNSFSFLTLQHLPTLHAPKVRPDLDLFFATSLRLLGVDVSCLLISLLRLLMWMVGGRALGIMRH